MKPVHWDPYIEAADTLKDVGREGLRRYVGRRLLGVAGVPSLNTPQGEQPEDFLVWLYRQYGSKQKEQLEHAVCDARTHFKQQVVKGHRERELPYLRACRLIWAAGMSQATSEVIDSLVDTEAVALSEFARALGAEVLGELLLLLAARFDGPDFWENLWKQRLGLGVESTRVFAAVCRQLPDRVVTFAADMFAELTAADVGSGRELRRRAIDVARPFEVAYLRGETPLAPGAPEFEELAEAAARATEEEPAVTLVREMCKVLSLGPAEDNEDFDCRAEEFAKLGRRKARPILVRRSVEERVMETGAAELYASSSQRWR